MRIVRLGLALSETVSARDLRGLPKRVSTALRRTDTGTPGTEVEGLVHDRGSIGADPTADVSRSGMSPYAHIRLLHRGASNPFEGLATEVEDGDHVDLVVRSPDGSVNRAERDADYWVFGGIYRPVYL